MASTATAAGPVAFQYHVPRGRLAGFVDVFWYWRGHNVEYSKERILPMATSELVIQLGTARTNGAGISGPHSESLIIERSAQDELLGIHFNYGGASPFIGFPLRELHGRGITLADLWGERRASELISRLHEAEAVEMKFQVLEQWLLTIATQPIEHHPAVAFAIREFERDSTLASSAAMAESVGFSQRRFIQLFRDEVGVTPKLFCRVQRFQGVIASLAMRTNVDWVDVALSCGYFDQSHFNHDFREFSGLSPTEYMTLRTEHLSHVLVRD